MKRNSHRLLAILFGVCAWIAALNSYVLAQSFLPVTDAMLNNPDPADWLMVSRTYDEQRFSPLNQINKSNVNQLRMTWARGLPAGTQESTPIVYRGVMYLFAPRATIQAGDATKGGFVLGNLGKNPTGGSGPAGPEKKPADS